MQILEIFAHLFTGAKSPTRLIFQCLQGKSKALLLDAGTLKIAFLKRQIGWDFLKRFCVFKTSKIFLYFILFPINFFGVSKRAI